MPEKISVKIDENTTLVGDYFDNDSDKGIVFFPGTTEHRSLLKDIALYHNHDFKTWTFDLNSQGESTGNWDLEEIKNSIYSLQKHLKKEHGLKKIGTFGHSMGGVAVGLAAIMDDSDIDCLCLSSTPGGIQDVLENHYTRHYHRLLAALPQKIVRSLSIMMDKLEYARNENYRKLSHVHFKPDGSYVSHAQWGALKVPDLRQLMNGVYRAQRLDDMASQITVPTFFVYGGNDALTGFRKNVAPRKIMEFYDAVGTVEKDILIAKGADHSLNKHTKLDEPFNKDEDFSYVKKSVLNHFSRYML